MTCEKNKVSLSLDNLNSKYIIIIAIIVIKIMIIKLKINSKSKCSQPDFDRAKCCFN